MLKLRRKFGIYVAFMASLVSLGRLKNPLQGHPFPVLARFERVVALAFAFPKSTLANLVPKGLELDVYEDVGFVAVALVWTRDLRPAGFPEWLGQDFFLAGYRVFTRMRDESGRNLRGLKIIRSETDKQRMVVLGNLMTGYNYRKVDVGITSMGDETRIITSVADGAKSLDVTLDLVNEPTELPRGSPFPDWRTARRFAGPLPFTFSPESDGSFIVVEGRRADWVPRPITVKNWQVGLFEETPLCGVEPILANAFAVENISYRWSKGRRIQPKGHV